MDTTESALETAKLFPDRTGRPEIWRVEWIDSDGGIEGAIFMGPKARERAVHYADRQYGRFDEVELPALYWAQALPLGGAGERYAALKPPAGADPRRRDRKRTKAAQPKP